MKIPIRVKLIYMDLYVCSKCKIESGLTNWNIAVGRDCSEIKKTKLKGNSYEEEKVLRKGYFADASGSGYYTSFTLKKEGNNYYCYRCDTKLRHFQKEKLKNYISVRNTRVNILNILTTFTNLQWKAQFGARNGGRWMGGMFSYPDDLKGMYKSLDWWNDCLKKNYKNTKKEPPTRIKLIKGITMKQLRKNHEDYLKKKVARAI